jgi:hypothetical protein
VTARDESERIIATIGALRGAFPAAPIVVGDDGSRDHTAALASGQSALVLAGPRRGKGDTATIAAARALEIGGPETVYLLCDADLGSSAQLLSALVAQIRAGRADLAIASFEVPRGGGFGVALAFARAAVRWVTGAELVAPLSGQRALSAAALRATLPFAPGFGMELAMTIDALRCGLRVSETALALEHRVSARTPRGFLHRSRQLLDFAVVFVRRAKVRRSAPNWPK